MKKHMIAAGVWSEEQHQELVKAIEADVIKAQKEAESYGSLADGHTFSNSTMFDDIYKDVPEHLRRQRRQLGV
jgi:2-oxoisovalerate dehydrogenase E1 component alpha subunit